MKKFGKKLLTMTLAASLVFGSSMTALAIDTETLSDSLVDENGNIKTKLTDLDNASGSFTIKKNKTTDTLTVYKIADFDFESGKMKWNTAVNSWASTHTAVTYKAVSYDFSKYINNPSFAATKTGPELLGAATSLVQEAFFNALMGINPNDQGVDLRLLNPTPSDDPTHAASHGAKTLIAITAENYQSSDVTDITGAVTKVTGYKSTEDGHVYLDGDKLPDGNTNTAYYRTNFSKTVTENGVEKTLKFTDMYKEVNVYVSGTNKRYVEGDVIQYSDAGSITFSDMPVGMYAVVGNYTDNGDPKKYSALTVSLVPEKDGANGNWYLTDVSTSLKSTQLHMEKYINEKKSDIVKIGEVVDFQIDFNLPTYENRNDLIDANKAKQYTLTFDDELDDAFYLITPSVTVQYYDSESESYKEFPKKYYSSFIANPNLTTTSDMTQEGYIIQWCGPHHKDLFTVFQSRYKYYVSAGPGTPLSDGNGFAQEVQSDEFGNYVWYYGYYYYRDGAYHMLVNDTPGAKFTSSIGGTATPVTPAGKTLTGDQILFMYAYETGDEIYHGVGPVYPAVVNDPDFLKNIFNVTFDYKKMLAEDFNPANMELRITYQAVVTDKIEPGSEFNTNTAKMIYEIDHDGKVLGTIQDTVRAYTYELQVIKEDGDTVGTDSPTYLEGAQFSLFRETNTYDASGNFVSNYDHEWYYSFDYPNLVGSKATGPDKNLTGEEYVAMKALNQTDYLNSLKAQKTTRRDSAGNLIDENKAEGKDYYLYPDGSGKVRVFELYNYDYIMNSSNVHFAGEFASNKEATGKKVNGIDVGNYILVETAAPDPAYNLLAEDIYFEINGLSKDFAIEQRNGSYASFFTANTADTSQDPSATNAVEKLTGAYDMTVLNYKGLQLPSTGGIGTTIFTIIGILIMLAAIVLVARRGNKKAMAGALSLLIIATSVFSGNGLVAHAETTVNLNNNANGAGVTGDGTTNFTIQCKNLGDTVEVYQVGSIKWNTDTGNYSEPTWVGGFYQDLTSQMGIPTFTQAGVDSFDTPVKLGAATSEEQVKFLSLLYDYMKEYGNSYNRSDMATTSDGGLTYTVPNQAYGIYLIKATGSTGKSYQPVTINVLPTQEGPFGQWFLKNNITIDLKYSDVTVDKTINGKSADTVMLGEVVEFVLEAEVPDYPAKVVTKLDANGDPQEVKTYEGYYFTLVDTMSEAFTLLKDDETGAPKDFKVEYLVVPSGGDPEWVEATKTITVDTKQVDVYDALFNVKEAKSQDKLGIVSYSTGVGEKVYVQYEKSTSDGLFHATWYYFNKTSGRLEKLYTNPSGVAKSAITYATPVGTKDLLDAYKEVSGLTSTSFTKDGDTAWEDVMAVGFDYNLLRGQGETDKVANPASTKLPQKVRVTYYATVTDLAKIGTDDNTNKVELFYQEDISGNIGKKPNEVFAWTYAAQVIKKDGDTKSILPGAVFKLYKEKYLYVPTIESASSDSNYTWASTYRSGSEEEATSAPVLDQGTEDVGDDVTLTTLDVAKANLNNIYVRTIEVAAGTCPDCSITAAHQHMMVYELYTNYAGVDETEGTFTSTTSADGFVIKGLEPASYILIETKAPDDYNKLNEAIRFEIEELTLEQAKAAYDAESLKGFKSDVTINKEKYDSLSPDEQEKYFEFEEDVYGLVYETGTYPIEVMNYKGLQLPSTGGMGTLLFTIIGIVVMSSAFIFVIVKRRRAY